MEHIKQDQIINIPNTLTVIRVLLLPVVVWRFVVGDATGALIAYLDSSPREVRENTLPPRTS